MGWDRGGERVGVEAVGSAGGSYNLIQIHGMLSLRRWNFCREVQREFIRRGFEVVNLGCGNIHKTRIVATHEQPRDRANDLASLVANAESLAQDPPLGPEPPPPAHRHHT